MLKKIKLMENTFFEEVKTKKKLINFIKHAKQLSMHKKVRDFEIKFSKIINKRINTYSKILTALLLISIYSI